MKSLVAAAFAVSFALTLFSSPARSIERLRAAEDKGETAKRKKEQDLIAKEILKKVGARHSVRSPNLGGLPSAHEAVRSGCAEAVSITFIGEAALQTFDQENICRRKEVALIRLEKMHANARLLTGVPADGAEIARAKEDLDAAYRRFDNLAAITLPDAPNDPVGTTPAYMAGVKEGRDFTVWHCPPPGGHGL